MWQWIIAIAFVVAVFCFAVDVVSQPKWRAVSAGLFFGFLAFLISALRVVL
jgi:hypothetical protein